MPTDKNNSQNELSFFQSIVDNVPDMIFVKEAKELRFVLFNKAGEELLGYKKEKMIGKNDYDFFPKDQAKFFIEKDLLTLKGKTTLDIPEEPIKTRLKGERILHTKKIPILDENGEPIYLLGISEDITEEIRTKKRYKTLYETSGDAIMTLEPPDWKFTSGNSAAINMFNTADEKEFISLGPWEVSPEKQPDGQMSSVKAKKMIMEAVKNGSNFFEWTHKRYKGEDFPATVLLSRVKEGEKTYLQATVRDITERKQLEKKLLEKETEKVFQLLFDSALDGILLADINTKKFVMANKFMCKQLGYSSEEITKLGVMDIHPKDAVSYVVGQFEKQAKGEKFIAKDIPIKRKDGSIFYTDINSAQFEFGGKKLQMGIFRDVTERKQAEQALLNSEEKFAAAFHASPELQAITRLNDGKIIDVNEGYSKMLGYSREESLGKTTAELSIWANAKDRAIFAGELSKTGEISRFETVLRRKDGKLVNVYDWARTVKIGGEQCILSVAQDITDFRKNEKDLRELKEKYETIVENGNDGIIIIQDYTVKFANSRMTEMLGYSLPEVLGKPFISFASAEYVKAIKEHYEKRLAGEKVENSYKIKLVKKGDGNLSVEVSGSIIDYKGKSADMVFIRDITLREKAEEELQKFKFIVEQSNQQIALATMDEILTYVNDAHAKNHGYKVEELIGKKLSILHPKEELSNVESFNKTLILEGRHTGEVVHMRKDGSIYPTLMDNFVLNIDSKPKYLVGMAVDITKIKEAEEEVKKQKSLLDSIVKSSHDALLVIDRQGKVAFFNDRFKKFWNIPQNIIKQGSDQELLNFVMDQLSDPKGFLDKVNYLYAHPEEESNDTINFKDGRIFERNSIPQKMDGVTIGRIWSFNDATEKTRLANQEKDRIDQIERINKLAIGRELKMVELKQEIAKLKGKTITNG